MALGKTSKAAELRARLDHPIVDADGHVVEFEPAVLDYLKDIGGSKMVDNYKSAPDGAFIFPWNHMTAEERLRFREFCPVWWGHPMANTLDAATSRLPKLLHKRLDEFGIDFAILYPSLGMFATELWDDDLRRAVCRAYNKYNSDILRDYSDRLTGAAIIPMRTPEEAIEELEYAVNVLGFKVVMMPASVRRAIPAHADKAPELYWLDNHCVDSIYNYDPVWQKCIELKVSPTFHSVCLGMSSRVSISNFVFNHLGHFGEAGHTAARALFLGGVTHRFPQLRFAFLEGGAGWACNLYNDLFMDWRTRNANVLPGLDPANLDRKQFEKLCAEYGGSFFTDRLERMFNEDASDLLSGPAKISGLKNMDDYAAAGIETESDIHDCFIPNFFFGCEGEDRMTAVAFDSKKHLMNGKLNAMFGSDIGHFDVLDMREPVMEAYEMVEKGLISADDFRDFVFTNPVKLHAEVNPDFFKGTVVEGAVKKLIGTKAVKLAA